MSYDLFFKPNQGEIDEQQFEEYFLSRPNYNVKMPQAWYENEDTGVYFVFEFNALVNVAVQEFGSEDEEQYPLTFNINYFRPSFFIHEASPEVEAFVKAFDLYTIDPQIDGMAKGLFNRESLIKGFLKGNEFAATSIIKQGDGGPVQTLPTKRLMEIWRWNYNRKALQEQLGEYYFVPKIMYLLMDGRFVTLCSWTDGIPMAVPNVDMLFVYRIDLAPRKFFRKKQDSTYIPLQDALPLMNRYRSPRFENQLIMEYRETPTEIKKFVQSLRVIEPEVERLSVEQVLDQELIEKASS